MSDIKVLNDRKRSKGTLLLLAVLGIALLALGIYTRAWYGIVAGAMLLASTLFRKETLVDEDGITIVYDARIYQYREEWPFDQIVTLHREFGKNASLIMLHFMKGAMSKRLLFEADDAARVIDLALSKNPKIHFDDVV